MRLMSTKVILPVLFAVIVAALTAGNSTAGDEQERAARAIEKSGGSLTLTESVKEGKRYDGLTCNPNTDLEAVMKEVRHLKYLETLYLMDGTPLRKEHLKVLATIPWLKKLILPKAKGSDKDMELVAACKGLEMVWIAESKVGDAGLKTLTSLENLVTIGLPGSLVTDDGVKELSRFKKLKGVTLGPRITQEGLGEIAKSKGLTSLGLPKTQFGAKGIKVLAPLNGLEFLDLSDTDVGDDALKDLAAFPNLVRLHLTGSQVTDAGLVHILPLKKLQALYLTRTVVGDAGVISLAELRSLNYLECRQSKVTEAGAKQYHALTKRRPVYK